MPARSRMPWLPRLLFRLAVAASLGLILLVIVSPFLDNGEPWPDGWARLAAVFARDAAVRRTAVASAVGLLVTACIFFRPPHTPPPRRPKPPRTPPPGAAGA